VIRLAVLLAAIAWTGGSSAETLKPESVSWCELDYEARKFFVTLEAQLDLDLEPAAALTPSLLVPSQSAGVAPAGPDVLVLRLRSHLRGELSDLSLLMDPSTGAAFELRRLDIGTRNRLTVMRYAMGGLLRTRVVQGPGQEMLPPASWIEQPDLWQPFPGWAREGLAVTDPSALFYLIAASTLAESGDVMQFPMYSNDQLLLVQAEVQKPARARVDYQLVDNGATTRVKEHRSLIRVALDARPLGTGSDERNFELAGLRGDVTMLIDAENRLPCEISGQVPLLGRVAIRLKRAVLNCFAP